MRIELFERAGKSRFMRAFSALVAGLVATALVAGSASADQTHIFLENFGSVEEQNFQYAQSAAVDQSSGDVLVVDAETKQISRFHADGTPSDFSDLGTNVIDGKGSGPPCAPPSVECDGTPQNGLSFGFNPSVVQIAVDDSGTATDGNIYITQNLNGGGTVQAIDIFAPGGEYLGQLTGAGVTSFSAGGPNSPCGVVVDPKGYVYVGGYEKDEIYKFDSAKNHVATFPSPLPCSLAAGTGPSAGSLFAIEFLGQDVFKLNSSSGTLVYVVHHSTDSNEHPQHVSVNPGNGHVFVTTSGTGQVFEYDASQTSGPTLISSFEEGSNGVAVDGSSSKLYLVTAELLKVYSGLVPIPEPKTTTASNIGKTSATLNGTVETFGEELTECFFEYVDNADYEPEAANPYAAGKTALCEESFVELGTGFAKVHADVGSLGEETAYHYRLIAGNANGRGKPGKDVEFRTRSKPELLGEWAEGVTLHEATLKAKINPQSAATEYRFEWGLTGAPYEHSTDLISIGNEPVAQTVSLFLQGLKANTKYHFRIFAENEMGTSTGLDHAFITFGPIPPPTPGGCPANEAFRTASSAFLPDCRAYEMVSPVDKNGGDIVSSLNGVADPGGYVQAAPDGNKIAYSARFASFAGEPNSFAFNQYIASRRERGGPGEGWSSEGIHPPVSGRKTLSGPFGFNREFMAFSPDLCSAWLIDEQTPPPTAEGQKDYPNLYRRENCGAGAGGLEALTSSPPPLGTDKAYVDRQSIQGISADSRHAVFIARAQLSEEANAGKNFQIYDRFGGANHLVSVLPGGEADKADARVGSGTNLDLDSAVSADGSLVYWTSGSGTIYLRRHPEQPQSSIAAGKCSEAARACTLAVSGPCDAFFWTAASNGSAALYTEGEEVAPTECQGEDLYEFDEQKGVSRLVADNVMGVAGASEDLSRIYFVSTEALTGEAEGEGNNEGDFAIEGQPNLYLEEGGSFSFVATLVAGDVGAAEPGAGVILSYSVVARGPYLRATRVTPDGAHIAFESRAPLTGYDSTDSATDKPAVEVFAYSAGGALRCISCNPSGGRPSGVVELRQPYKAGFEERGDPTFVRAAAWIPTWEHPLHASNVLSVDGGRLFFNSLDALLPRDTNGAQDVYEWEAPGTGGCHAGDADYFPRNGGCLYLISSGESPSESEFWEASPDGRDVFFNTASSLLPQDPGLIDLYDARVEGGFPQPIVKAPCEGEACQTPPSPPEFANPASATEPGPGNAPRKHGCPKGKHRVGKAGKAHCVKKHKKKQSKGRRAKHNRRAAR